jgi:hypothetical protein
MKSNNTKVLTCACCGGLTKGRQWWNQDTGYGLCSRCAQWIASRHGSETVEQDYGKFGVHHSCENESRSARFGDEPISEWLRPPKSGRQ